MSKPKYLKRITKLSQLKAGARYMRMYINAYNVDNDTCTPRGRVFVFRADPDSFLRGSLQFRTLEKGYNSDPYTQWCSTWLSYSYTVKWSSKAEAFFNTLKKDRRRAWEFLTDKFSQLDWERFDLTCAMDRETDHAARVVCARM